MIPLDIAALAALLGARVVPGTHRDRIEHVMTDSRIAAPGPALFFALRTDRADGHDHVTTAVRAGARGCSGRVAGPMDRRRRAGAAR